MTSPFDLNSIETYEKWRQNKLAAYPFKLDKQFVTIKQADQPSEYEVEQIKQSCKALNMAFYRFEQKPKNDKRCVHRLGKSVGLHHLDHNICADDDYLTSLKVTQHKGQHDYIPYTNKQLSWHTDGYYNKPNEQIKGMLLHCSTPAMSGGESLLLDHEILYILLRDENPAWIKALSHPEAMTIPPNILDGKEIRPARSGSVFSVGLEGQLHLRYSARLRNIEWAKDVVTQAAIQFIQRLWDDEMSPYILRYKLKAGEGVICNNVLHRRTNFEDSLDMNKQRLLYRGRYYDRVKSTRV